MATVSVTASLQNYASVAIYNDTYTWLELSDPDVGLDPTIGAFFSTPAEGPGAGFANNFFGGTNYTKSLGRAFFFFSDLNATIGSGNIITSATLKINGGGNSLRQNTLNTILVSGSAWGGDGSNSDLSSEDFYNLESSISYSSILPSPWNIEEYNTFTLNSNAISDMNSNGYLNCVLINAQYDQAGVTPTPELTSNERGTSITYENTSFPIQLDITYSTPPPSVIQSVKVSPDDLTAGTPVTYSIENPLQASSYFVLETVSNANGIYDSNSPKNLQGTFTLGAGIIDVISDDYKAGIIVAPGGGDLVFTPTNNVIASTLLLKGMGWSGPVYPKPLPPPTITCPPENGIGLYFLLGETFFILAKFTHSGDDSQGLPTYNFPQVITAGSEINFDLNYTSPQWGLSVTIFEREIDAATSSDLVSSNWTSAGDDLVVSSTTCGYPSAPDFCVVMPGVDGNIQVNILPIFPSMDDINTDPIGYFAFFVDLVIIWLPAVGSPAGWSISISDYSLTISGGSVDSPPTGTFILTSNFDPSDTITITISAGVCSI